MPLPIAENSHTTATSAHVDAHKQKSPVHASEGDDKALHAAQKFMATDLITHRKIKLTDLGADRDIIDCFGKDKFTDVITITNPGSYLLNPCDLTPNKMQEIIEHGLDADGGEIELFVPVCFKNHWRLIKLKFAEHSLKSANLWDSLSTTSEEVLQLLQEAVNTAESSKARVRTSVHIEEVIQVRATAAGVQSNDHSCMDYVIQEIYQSNDLSLDNVAIRNAPDASSLRLAVVKQIAVNVPELGATFAENLQIAGDFIVENVELTDEHQKFQQSLVQGGDVQKSFDAEFANQLFSLQQNIKNETQLQKVAFIQAYSLFKKKKPDAVQPVLDKPTVLTR